MTKAQGTIRTEIKPPKGRENKQPTTVLSISSLEGHPHGGDSSSGRKQYARQSLTVPRIDLGSTEDITFEVRDLESISFPYDDALVISAIIANFEVKMILVDNGSVTNVLSHESFIQMDISTE